MGFKRPLLRADGALLTDQVQAFAGITSIDVVAAVDASEAKLEDIREETLKEVVAAHLDLHGLSSFAERHYDLGSRQVVRLYFAAGDVGGKLMPDDDLD